MKSLLSIGLVLIWASVLNANSLRNVLTLRNENVGPRIVGGRDAQPHEFPYIVSLTLHTLDDLIIHQCGGSILNERWVLTSSYCFGSIGIGEVVIRAGAHFLNETMEGEQTSTVNQIIWYPASDAYDIALVELDTPFTFSETVQSIALPPQDEMPLEGSVIAAGWGATYAIDIDGKIYTTNPNTLQTMELPLITNADCKAQSFDPTYVQEYHVCTPKGVCYGDAGGPLVQNNKVVAVIAPEWPDCDRFPSYYQRVSICTNWINSNIN